MPTRTEFTRVTDRLFRTSFELGQDVEALRWCNELRTLFSGGAPYASCRLMLAGWGDAGDGEDVEPWAVIEESVAGDPAPMRDAVRPRLEMLAAAVLARRGVPDSARAVLERASAAAGPGHDLLLVEAAVWTRLGEFDKALDLLDDYESTSPAGTAGAIGGRWFLPLRGLTRFRRLAPPTGETRSQPRGQGQISSSPTK